MDHSHAEALRISLWHFINLTIVDRYYSSKSISKIAQNACDRERDRERLGRQSRTSAHKTFKWNESKPIRSECSREQMPASDSKIWSCANARHSIRFPFPHNIFEAVNMVAGISGLQLFLLIVLLCSFGKYVLSFTGMPRTPNYKASETKWEKQHRIIREHTQ